MSAAFALAGACTSAQQPTTEPTYVNAIGIEFVRIEPGTFRMGESATIPERYLSRIPYLTHGDWDEHPVREVTISEPFYISVMEITADQFRRFRESYEPSPRHATHATGVSWHEASAFAQWLSREDGIPYRLPTEAEWEYVCRAGTETLFWSGESPPDTGQANPWGVRNLHTGVSEWVLDWHGAYPASAEVDPLGPASGHAKVVRGGGLDDRSPYYARCANRAGIAPAFPPVPVEELRAQAQADLSYEVNVPLATAGFESREAYDRFVREELGRQGDHPIGFRLVIGELPPTEPGPVQTPDFQERVRQATRLAQTGPDPALPYFRSRSLQATPPQPVGDTAPQHLPGDQIVDASLAGLHPAMLSHLHSPGLEVAPNGDVIAVYYTSVSETTPDVALIASRLRFGQEEWDLPSLFLDFPDVNDHAPMLWRDGETLYLYWGANRLDSGFPFQWVSSHDNGATWSEPRFPVFETPVGPHSAQPINSAFRGDDGPIYVASDGHGITSQLWVSENDGQTWQDRGGRTAGRHTTFAPLSDGRLFGIGGKNSNIDGFLPQFVSADGGRTWSMERSPFPTLDANQRPTLLRLQSGRLFYAGDFQRIDGYRPPGVTGSGAFAAISDDDGASWRIRPLPGLAEHKYLDRRTALGAPTLGYSVARQAPNGVIHLITSMNHRNLHLELNEAWILADDDGGAHDDSGDRLTGESADRPISVIPAQAGTHSERQHRTPAASPNGRISVIPAQAGTHSDPEIQTPASPEATLRDVRTYEEHYANGTLRARYEGGVDAAGRFLLHGRETWHHESGSVQYEAMYDHGHKVGTETSRSEDGQVVWEREHHEDGSSRWTQYRPNGQRKSETHWRGLVAHGPARHWSPDGELLREVRFEDGALVRAPDESR